jgi:hypothetical protein
LRSQERFKIYSIRKYMKIPLSEKNEYMDLLLLMYKKRKEHKNRGIIHKLLINKLNAFCRNIDYRKLSIQSNFAKVLEK